MADFQSVFPESQEQLTSDEIQKVRSIIQGYPTHNHDGRNTLEVATNTVRNSVTSQQILSPSDITAGQDLSNGNAVRITSTSAFIIEGVEGTPIDQTSSLMAQNELAGMAFSVSDFEQGMTASGQGIVGLNLYLRLPGSSLSRDVRCSIYNDSSGSPGATEHVFEQKTISLTGTFSLQSFTFTGFIPTPGTTYWAVLKNVSFNADDIYIGRVSGSGSYTKKINQLPGSTWAADGDSNDWWFNLMFIEANGNRVVKCNAKSTDADNLYVGISNMDAQTNQSMEYISLGTKSDFTSLQTAGLYYVSDTGGTLSLTPGRNSIIVGKALSSTLMFLQPPPLN